MPSISPQRGHLSYENPSLSDQDVGFLYQIITRAERHPEADRLPFRALFDAYDEVLEEHGVDADQGQVCLRFLFKMGSKGVQGGTLFEKFENLLAQLGIVLELDDGDTNHDGHETYPRDLTGLTHRQREDHGTSDRSRKSGRRRSSFNSMYDVGEDATQRSFVNRPSSRSSMSRLQVGKPEFAGSDASLKRNANPQRPGSPDRTQLLAQFLEAGRRLMSRMRSAKEPKRKPDERPLPNGHLLAPEVERTGAQGEAGSYVQSVQLSSSDADDEEEPAPEVDRIRPFPKPPLPPAVLYKPSLSDLLRDATTFDMYRQRALIRRILTQWLKKAIQAQQAHRNMELVAANSDRFTLIRQAFETWRSVIQRKRQADRTERFFKHLEARAGRARDLYLMTRAFTHWAQLTSDEVARTSAARRHILSVKYFNAWREITAVNELKAQRFALRRPFNQWRNKVRSFKALEAQTLDSYNRHLVRETYWRWVLRLCEQRAPLWHDHCLMKRSLIAWLRKVRTNRERDHEVEVGDKLSLIESALQVWSQRSDAIRSAEKRAASMYQERMLRRTFDEWRIQGRLAPAASRISGRVDTRVLRDALNQWKLRAYMQEQADWLDRRRLMRNSWTSWNDLLRSQALTARIEERLKVETMYKWVLAERCRLMQRIRDQRVAREVFSTFVTNIRQTYSRLLYRADVHQDQSRKETLRSKLDHWRARLVLQRERDMIAHEFYAPRLQGDSLAVWREKFDRLRTMTQWAQRADFYFLMMRISKRWHQATVDSSKRRRQEAYAKTRRKIKVNMATKCLTTWAAKTQRIIMMEQEAKERHRNKILRITVEIVHQWHEMAGKRWHDSRAADDHRARRLAYDHLTRLAEALVENHNRMEQADQFYHLHVQNHAAAQLRKLSLRVFQIKSSEETGQAMRERHLRRHARVTIRHWAEKTRLRLQTVDSPGPSIEMPVGGIGPDRNASHSHSLFEPWYQVETPFKFSDFVDASETPQPSSSTTPNYMTSPSRRAARARALAQISTTPATPLYTPFATRLLREQGATPKMSSLRRGRSARPGSITASVRFVDDIPESPSEGRRSANRRT